MAVRIEIKPETLNSREPAKIVVYDGDRLVTEIIAKVELSPGADGGMYNCVTLKENTILHST